MFLLVFAIIVCIVEVIIGGLMLGLKCETRTLVQIRCVWVRTGLIFVHYFFIWDKNCFITFPCQLEEIYVQIKLDHFWTGTEIQIRSGHKF